MRFIVLDASRARISALYRDISKSGPIKWELKWEGARYRLLTLHRQHLYDRYEQQFPLIPKDSSSKKTQQTSYNFVIQLCRNVKKRSCFKYCAKNCAQYN